MLTITPSENTHFRVILSTEAMEEREEERTDPICSIVKPEPRTIKPDECSCSSQRHEALSGNTNMTSHKTDLSDLMSSSLTSGACLPKSDLSPKAAHAIRWKSSPPSCPGSVAADSAAVCPDSRSKPSDSPAKRRGSTHFYNSITVHYCMLLI